MSVAVRFGVFAAGLLAVFAAGAAIGSLLEPTETEGGGEHDGGEHRRAAGEAAAGSEGGYSLRLEQASIDRGEEGELRFAIADPDGEAVRNFDELHERRMHLIVVRRDGRDFRHLHPDMDESGTWAVPIEFREAGTYRAFADFSVAGEQRTLAADLSVGGGEFEAHPFPPPAPLDSTDGYEIRLRPGDLDAGGSSALTFAVSRNGAPVDDLAPYLGAKGHLVALREGDLAFLHVHPVEAGSGHVPEEGAGGHAHEHGHAGHPASGAAEEIAFAATFPTAGRYRLYLQFKHEGAVRTAQFTVAVPR